MKREIISRGCIWNVTLYEEQRQAGHSNLMRITDTSLTLHDYLSTMTSEPETKRVIPWRRR